MRGRLVWAAVVAAISTVSLVSQAPQRPDDTFTLRIIVSSSAEEAQRIAERLTAGENFVALAMAESIDPSARSGGWLGRVAVSSLRPELRAALQGLSAGQLTPVVQIPTGFAVLKRVEDDETAAAAPSRLPALDATGSVKYLTQIGGFSEAEAVMRAFPKPAGWNLDPGTICEIRRESLAKAHQRLDDFLVPQNDGRRASEPPSVVVDVLFTRGQLYAYEGEMQRAIQQLEEAHNLAVAAVPTAVPGIELALGTLYLHKAGMDNDAHGVRGDMCLLPVEPGRVHQHTKDSDKAIEHFRNYLGRQPDELGVRWLLNLAYMTIGGYPGRVPAPYVVPPAVFTSAENIGRFRDVAGAAGLTAVSTAGGVIVDDFTGAGQFEIVTSNFDSCASLHYFGNNGDGTFNRKTSAAGLDNQLGGLNLMQADYNNDGCMDILVLRGGWQLPQRKSLMRNNCDGTFTDMTMDARLAEPTSTQTAAWADVDNDGFVDLFVGNEDSPSQLFLNKRNGTFEDIAASAGVNRVAFTKGVSAADYDNDGFTDFYVSNLGSRPFLYRNNRDNTFSELAEAAGVQLPAQGFAAWFFDYDNDGWQDLFATSYFRSLDETVRTYVGLPANATTLQLHKNLKDGSFRNVTVEAGLDKVFMPMGANFGDIDNDGFLDIYLGNGEPSYASLVPYVLLRNRSGRSFVDVTASSGTGELHKGHGVAFADVDHDGDQDLVVAVGGVTPGERHAMRLFENPGHGNDWISLKLVGVKTNRAAMGARIRVTVENDGQGVRSIHRTVGSGGSFGASPLEQHIGLGKATGGVDLEIWWPATGTRQHFRGVGTNQVLEIRELAREYRRVERPVVRLGGSRRAP